MKLKKTITTTFEVEEMKFFDLDFDVRTYNSSIFYLMQKFNKTDSHQAAHMSALVILLIDIDEFSKVKNVGKKTVDRLLMAKNELMDSIKNGEVCLVKI